MKSNCYNAKSNTDHRQRTATIPLKPHGIEIPWPIMKMTKRMIAQAQRMRAARLQSPKRTSADAYAQLDQFLRVSDTEPNGERSSNGAKKKA